MVYVGFPSELIVMLYHLFSLVFNHAFSAWIAVHIAVCFHCNVHSNPFICHLVPQIKCPAVAYLETEWRETEEAGENKST